MTTIHLVSHTHWDREWYLPFQRFRLKLVHLVDDLLALLESSPDFKFFTLDGQTIVLDDYLQVRPERFGQLQALVQAGKLLIGPWHILPDEFLVSPEATIRNLLEGGRTARRFGPKMMVGYIPDPFGHLAQMPQILRGFGIQSAAVQRGLSDEPCEFWWQAPDGSRVWMAHLRDGYGNAARLPADDPDAFTAEVERLRDSLLPHTRASHVLLMHGTDHTEPPAATAQLVGYANDRLNGDRLVHSTLPAFIAAVQLELQNPEREVEFSLQEPSPSQQPDLPVVSGELRSSKRHHLLPAVLSTRLWIKQRNHACETLLERWAEPFSAFASLLLERQLPEGRSGQPVGSQAPLSPADRLDEPQAVLRQAWRLLMECHPHDSICGCSIDQVHVEMLPRFDQVEQIGEEITRQSLEALAAQANTLPGPASPLLDRPGRILSAVCAFNPLAGPRTDLATVQVQLPGQPEVFQVVDAAGNILPHRVLGAEVWEVASLALDWKGLQDLLADMGRSAMESAPFLQGMIIQDIHLQPEGEVLLIRAALGEAWQGEAGLPEENALEQAIPEFMNLLASGNFSRFLVKAEITRTSLEFLATDVPGHGYKTFYIRQAPYKAGANHPEQSHATGLAQIENEFFTVQALQDGALELKDKRTGITYSGLNRFVDGGDCGDEYNYSPPDQDRLAAARLDTVKVGTFPTRQTIELSLVLEVPAKLSDGRKSRGTDLVRLPIRCRASLAPGVPRLDFEIEIENSASDHRLRVHFPFPFHVDHAFYDGHFIVSCRPLGVPPYDATWAEQPRPEQPQRAFCFVSSGAGGLLLANRGLPEVEVIPQDSGGEIALTLLRCVGWLSRDDFPTRRGHAGPGLPTPGAQLQGRWRCEYSLVPIAGGQVGELRSIEQAYAFNTPLRAISTPLHTGSFPVSGNLLAVQPADFVLSAVKLAEDGDGWVVRGFNLGTAPLQVSLTPAPWLRPVRAAQANLAEEIQSELPVTPEGSVHFEAGAHAICTLRFW